MSETLTPTAATRTTGAQVLHAFGGPEELRPQQLPLSDPAAGQVQVAVAAAAVNPVDLTTRAGRNIPVADARFPLVLGWDAAGTVEAIADGVQGWAVGDRVAAMTFQPVDQNGTYAEHLDLDAALLARVPDGLSLEQAATVPLAGLTAVQLLQELGLAAGASLLVNGPLGGVGRFLVQLAARDGVRVVAVCRPDQRQAVTALGAAETVDRGDFTAALRARRPEGVEAAVDLVGGATSASTIAAVRDGGTYRTAVPPYVDPTGVFEPQRGIRVDVHTVRPDAGQLSELLALVAAGALTSPVERTYPLAQAAQAHLRQSQGGLSGKLVLLP